MIRDLVLYLLRQGCYSNEGDIVVLCAYLGQLARLRDALAKDVAISIDERDQAELDDQEAEKDSDLEIGTIQRVSVTKRVISFHFLFNWPDIASLGPPANSG